MRQRLDAILLLSIVVLLGSCVQRESEGITVNVTPAEITIEGKEIVHEEFEKTLKKVVDRKVEQGLKKEDLFVHLLVDSNTKRGQIADIELSLRRLNIRKILYSAIPMEGQGS